MSEEQTRGGSRFLEIIAVLLLGITTVGTAWCGYQASQWNGEQGELARQGSDQRVEASRLFGLATQRMSYDAGLIGQYATATQSGNTALAAFYRTNLVRPDFLPVLDQWETQLRAGQTPTNLFEDPDYRDAQFRDYQKAQAQAEVFTQESQQAAANANAYVITTILLAVALFFAGVTSSFQYTPARAFLLILALGTVAVAAARLADLPVA